MCMEYTLISLLVFIFDRSNCNNSTSVKWQLPSGKQSNISQSLSRIRPSDPWTCQGNSLEIYTVTDKKLQTFQHIVLVFELRQDLFLHKASIVMNKKWRKYSSNLQLARNIFGFQTNCFLFEIRKSINNSCLHGGFFLVCLGGLWLSFDGVMISYWRTPPNIDSSLSSDSAHPLYTIDSDCSFQCNSQSDGHYNSTPRNQRTLNIPGKHLKNYTTMLLVHTSWQKYLCTVRWLEIFQL